MARNLNIMASAPYGMVQKTQKLGERIRAARKHQCLAQRSPTDRAEIAYEPERAAKAGLTADEHEAYPAFIWAFGLEQ